MGEARSMWADKFAQHKIDYVLENLEVGIKAPGKDLVTKYKAPESVRKSLNDFYYSFEKMYKKLVDENIAPYNEVPANLDRLKKKVLELTNEVSQGKTKIGAPEKNKVPDIMAHLFSIWTLQDSISCYQKLNKSGDTSDQNAQKFLLKPHAA